VFGFLANGDTRHATIAFNAGILPVCIERLSSGDLDARIKSAWILGNLAADNTECAEALMERGVLAIMFDQMTTITNSNEISSHGSYSSMLLWAINHFIKSTPGLTPNIVSLFQAFYLSIWRCCRRERLDLVSPCQVATGVDLERPRYSASTADYSKNGLSRTLYRNTTSIPRSTSLTHLSPQNQVLPIQNLLSTILLSNVEDVILEETCYTLASILQLSTDAPYGAPFTSEKTCARLIRLLQRGSNIPLQRAALQLVGTLTGRSDEYTTLLLGAHLLPSLSELIEHPLGEDACWVLSNVVAENVRHLEVVVRDEKVLPTVIRLLKVDSSGFDEDEFAGRTRECCAILAAVIRMGEVGCIRRMVALGGVGALCTALRYVAEGDVLVVILDALWKVVLFGESDRIVVRGEGEGGGEGREGGEGRVEGEAEEGEESVNLYLKLFEESGGFDGLYRLEDRKDRVVAEAAQQMLALVSWPSSAVFIVSHYLPPLRSTKS
jgi:hypothetical protein